MSEDIKGACAWSALALGMRFAKWQKQEAREKVKKLQEQLEEQKLFTNVLVGMVKKRRDMQGREMEKAQFHRQQILVILRGEEAQQEVLRNELGVGSSQPQKRRQTEEEERKETQDTRYACFCSGCNKLLGRGGGREGLRPGRAGESDFCRAKDQQGEIFPCSEVSGAWAQAGRPLCLGLSASSYSFLPMLSLPGMAAEATAVPPVENPRNTWNGR